MLVTNDLFDIASRLRSIDPDYQLYFNYKTQRYEVYDGRRDKLAFVVPYQQLDARTLDYARFTSVQNAKNLFAEVERNNEEVERIDRCRLRQKVLERAEAVLSAKSDGAKEQT